MSQADEKLVIEGGQVKVLTQSRQSQAAEHSGVIVDYLRFTVVRQALTGLPHVSEGSDDQSLTRWAALQLAQLLGFDLGDERPGRDYYDYTTTIVNAFGHEVASVSGGGEGQRGTFCFTMKGEACTFAALGWERRVHVFFSDLAPKITRLDLTRDFYEGEVTIENAVQCYKDHAFSYRKRLPSCSTPGDWINGHSRTFQVGQRESGKLCRVYEKGHQYKLMSDPWVRVEVELRNVNRVIPWDALASPGGYFAGAYEFCNWLIHHHEVKPIKTQTKVAEAGVQAAINWVHRVVAPTLVQISSALPDFTWLEDLVIHHSDRKVPRALRGLNHHTLRHGLEKAFQKISTNPGLASPVIA